MILKHIFQTGISQIMYNEDDCNYIYIATFAFYKEYNKQSVFKFVNEVHRYNIKERFTLKKLEIAIELRKEGKLKESNKILISLAKEYPNDPIVNYQCAWSFDVLGLEVEAVPYYEKAILIGLPDKELQGAFLGLGSTYRTLGQYEKSKEVFEQGLAKFTENKAMKVFYAMTLYNLKEYSKAMEILLYNLAHTSSDENIKNYRKAIEFYSDKLNEIW